MKKTKEAVYVSGLLRVPTSHFGMVLKVETKQKLMLSGVMDRDRLQMPINRFSLIVLYFMAISHKIGSTRLDAVGSEFFHLMTCMLTRKLVPVLLTMRP